MLDISSVEQDAFLWEANSRSTCHEMPHSLRKPKFNHHVHKKLQLIPALSKMNPMHILTSCFNIILACDC
jgi:hypothetical protein